MLRRSIPGLILLLLYGCGGGGSASSTGGTTDSGAGVAPQTNTAQAPAPAAAPSATDVQLRAALARGGVVAAPVAPPQDPAKVALGEALMFDKLLSGNKDIACATCHHPQLAAQDGLSTSIGTGGSGLGPTRTGGSFIARNAPALWNRSSVQTFFLDGRVSGNSTTGFVTPAGGSLPGGLENALAAQAMFPVTVPEEMLGVASPTNELARLGGTDFPTIWNLIMARIEAVPAYVTLFQAAYPGVPQTSWGFQHAANAIAAFEIDRFSPLNSPFDRYLAGDDTALNDTQKRGALLFFGTARCAVCHRGPLLSDLSFHNIAAPQVGPGKGAEAPLDFGRGRETGLAADRFRFLTPILRNVAVSGPWTHSGGYTSLTAIVRHYINPGQALRNYNASQLDPRFQTQVHVNDQIAAGVLNSVDPVIGAGIPLNPQEVSDLVSFLESLTDPGAFNVPVPASVPSGLPVVD